MASKARNTSRRSRAAQACITCRKNKARCELLDDLKTSEVLRCHRCKTLDLRCSYQDADRQSLRLGRKPGISQAWEQLVDFTDVKAISQSSPLTTTPTTTSLITGSQSPEESTPIPPISTALDLKVLPQSIWKYRLVDFGQWRYCGTDVDDDHYDWSTPMSAVHQISAQHQAQLHNRPRMKSEGQTQFQSQVELLEDILEDSQIKELLQLFDESFSPWLGFSLIHSDSFPLLDLVCCTISSRKLSSSSSVPFVVDRLICATERAVSQIVLRPPAEYVRECIQALILIALWEPLSDSNEPEEGWRDPHLLLSCALSLATKIRLNEAPEKYSTLKKMREQGLEVDPLQLASAADLARLWVSLTNAELLSCIGTYRTPFSERQKTYLKCFPRSPSHFSPSTLADNTEAMDVRLRLLAETLGATEEGLSVRLNGMEEFESWHHAMTGAFQKIDNCTRILLPLRVMFGLDHTLFYRVQAIVTRCCRLLVIHNPVNAARRLSIYYGHGALESRSYSNIFAEVFTPWGKEALLISEEIFVSFQELLERIDRDESYVQFLASTPDYFFHLIQLAGVFLISFKFMVFNARRCVLPGSSDLLLESIIQRLKLLQVPRKHPASTCADLLRGLLELWMHREELLSSVQSQPQQHQQIPTGSNRVDSLVQGQLMHTVEGHGREQLGDRVPEVTSVNETHNATAIAASPTEYLSASSISAREIRQLSQNVMMQTNLDLSSMCSSMPNAITVGMIDNPHVGDEFSDIFQDVQFWQNLSMHQPMSGQ
ncbi:hypothetical protein F5051DRAFT_48950 [Lentinula edodes]|nr:hypothetical protein F5051DRAFT_48950 [Lentinula edodes]